MTEQVQVVAFVRHGIARHNLWDPVTRQPPRLEDPNLWDPPLVYEGKQQALEAGECIKTWCVLPNLVKKIELIVTSPLTRCIQTTLLGFLPGDGYTSSTPNSTMTGENHRFTVPSWFERPMGCIIQINVAAKSLLQKHWPTLTFDKNMTEDDDAWSPVRRETVKEIQERIAHFMEILSQCQETNIVVVSHGVWIESCIKMYCPQALQVNGGQQRVQNCNVFVGECISREGKFLRLQNVRRIH